MRSLNSRGQRSELLLQILLRIFKNQINMVYLYQYIKTYSATLENQKKPELILPLGGFTPGRCLSSCCSPSLHPPIQSPERREGAQQPLPQEHLGRQPGQPDHAPPQRQPHPPARAVGHRPAHGHRPLRRRPGESHRHGEERAPGGCSLPSAFTSSVLPVNQSVNQT